MEESHEGICKRKYNFTQQVGNFGDLLALEVVEAMYKQTQSTLRQICGIRDPLWVTEEKSKCVTRVCRNLLKLT